MERSTRASGPWGLNRARASGRAYLEIHTSANGNSPKPQAMVYINGKMAIDMRANGLAV